MCRCPSIYEYPLKLLKFARKQTPLSHHVLDLAFVSPVVRISLYVDDGKGSYLYFYDFLHRVSCLEPQNHETLCALRQAAGPGKPTSSRTTNILHAKQVSAPVLMSGAPGTGMY